jgi:hypothetical protein
MATKRTHTGYRSSVSGKFVRKNYAETHKRTTQREQIPNPGRGDTGRGKRK